MESGNIFGRKVKPAAPKQNKQAQPPADPGPKQRKKRADAHKDIKCKLSRAEKQSLEFRALDHGMSLTKFATKVVSYAILHNEEFAPFECDNEGEFIHVVLPPDLFKMVNTLKVEWGISRRQVVHRILKNYLHPLKINDYRGGGRK